jgi:hypothetical protein
MPQSPLRGWLFGFPPLPEWLTAPGPPRGSDMTDFTITDADAGKVLPVANGRLVNLIMTTPPLSRPASFLALLI